MISQEVFNFGFLPSPCLLPFKNPSIRQRTRMSRYENLTLKIRDRFEYLGALQ